MIQLFQRMLGNLLIETILEKNNMSIENQFEFVKLWEQIVIIIPQKVHFILERSCLRDYAHRELLW